MDSTKMTAKDMPNEDMKLVAESCGVETARSLLENCPGLSIFIPKIQLQETLENDVLKDYSKKVSAKRIALKYGVSLSYVYKVLGKNKEKVNKIKKQKRRR